MNRNRLYFILLITMTAALAGCGIDDSSTSSVPNFKPPVITPQKPYEKKVPVRYVYGGDKRRDPFLPLISEGSASVSGAETGAPNVGSLVLKGLFDDGKQRFAMISAGGITYLLKGSHLYDNRQRLIRGITGIIKPDSVIIIGPDKTAKELKLREK